MEICIFQSKLKKLKKQFSLSYTLGKRNFEKEYFLKRKLLLCFGKQLSELEKWKTQP